MKKISFFRRTDPKREERMVYEFGEEQARNTLLHTIVIISGADVKLNTIKAIYRKTVSPIDVLLPARELDVSERSLSSRKAKKIVEVPETGLHDNLSAADEQDNFIKQRAGEWLWR